MAIPDVDALVREQLAAHATLASLAGSRIYVGRDLPAGYTPADGPAVLARANGGTPDYANTIRPSLQVRCYGLTEGAVREVSRAVFDALHDLRSGRIVNAQCDILGQSLSEPDTGWLFELSYYRLQVLLT